MMFGPLQEHPSVDNFSRVQFCELAFKHEVYENVSLMKIFTSVGLEYSLAG